MTMGDLGERISSYQCDICAVRMPFRDIERHKRYAHAHIMHLRRECAREGFPSFLSLAVSAAVIWSVGILTVAYLAEEFVLAAVIGFSCFLISMVGYASWSSEKAMGPYYEALLDAEMVCSICGSWMKRSAWPQHEKDFHPEDVKTVKLGLTITIVLALVPSVLGTVASWKFIAGAGDLNLLVAGTVGVFSLIFAMLFVGLCWYPRQEARERDAWRESHPGSGEPSGGRSSSRPSP